MRCPSRRYTGTGADSCHAVHAYTHTCLSDRSPAVSCPSFTRRAGKCLLAESVSPKELLLRHLHRHRFKTGVFKPISTFVGHVPSNETTTENLPSFYMLLFPQPHHSRHRLWWNYLFLTEDVEARRYWVSLSFELN